MKVLVSARAAKVLVSASPQEGSDIEPKHGDTSAHQVGTGMPGAAGGPCRVAALGDSHTQGDDFTGPHFDEFGRLPWAASFCRMGNSVCRGNYPRILQGLLGAEFLVRNFGATGRAAVDFVPQVCVHPLINESVIDGTPLQHVISELVEQRKLQNEPACDAALRQTKHFKDIVAFQPHVAVLLLGTNDAIHTTWKRVGKIGYAQSMASIIFGLWKTTSAGPSVLVLEPPLTMSDNPFKPFSGPNCMRMHNCRYHPTYPCWTVAECITCSDRDKLDSDDNDRHGPGHPFQAMAHKGCVRLDGLRALRATLKALFVEIHRRRGEHRVRSAVAAIAEGRALQEESGAKVAP